MDMRKARGVRNNNISNKRWLRRVGGHFLSQVQRFILSMWFGWRSQAISSLDTRSPAPHQYLLDTLASLGDFSALYGIKPGHEARVLDHEGHELCRITANIKELEAIVFNKSLESRMRGDANPMAIRLLERLAKRNKRLDITS